MQPRWSHHVVPVMVLGRFPRGDSVCDGGVTGEHLAGVGGPFDSDTATGMNRVAHRVTGVRRSGRS